METKELTQSIRRKTFKRTFLRDVTAKVTFAETNLLGNGVAIRTFLRDKFGIQEDFNIPKLGRIDISSDGKEEVYKFTTDSASVTISSNIYRYFEDSLKPSLDIILSFLQTLGIEEAITFSITKRNLFPGNAKNAFSAWRFALVEAFKADGIRSMADINPSPEKPFKMSIDGGVDTGWGEIKVPFMVNVPDKNNFQFILDIEAISKPIPVSEIRERGVLMNNEIFDSFISIISDKLINLMQQD